MDVTATLERKSLIGKKRIYCMFVFVVLVVSFIDNMAFFNNIFKIRKAFAMGEMLASPSPTSTLF